VSVTPAADSPFRERLVRARATDLVAHPLLLLLALASLLRLMLVVQGGQLYWPDERLYTQVLDTFDLHQGYWFDILKALFSTQDHLGFALISAPIAAIQFAIGHALSRSGNGLMLLPGIVLSQASVISIALVYAIARRAGRDRVEALIAAALMASATTMFYYARHLLPYDVALTLGLLALWCAIGTSRRDSLMCGAAASAAFITYNGYWLLVAAVLLLHMLHEGRTTIRSAAMRGIYAVVGFLAVPAAIVLIELLTGAPLMFSGMRRLAGTVSDGYAPEGFSLPWAYLWHAEHALLLAWIGAAVFVVVGRTGWNPRRQHTAATWVIAAVFIYLALGCSSAIFHVFVVMGRQARQVVPFLCLATAAAAVELLERRRWPSWIVAAGVIVLVAQTGWNFRQPLQQRFPRDVIAEITTKYGPIDFENTIEGPPLTHEHVESRWVLLNAQHLYNPRTPRPPLPSSVIEVMRFRHPQQFVPYQYEGLRPTERQVLSSSDISMRLIDIGAPVDRLP
jgi:Dolichyl-phosphate-mannose-protein mannosyltransferase